MQHAKINVVLSTFQNVSTCQASLEAEQRKGSYYVAAQRTPRESLLTSQLYGVNHLSAALRSFSRPSEEETMGRHGSSGSLGLPDLTPMSRR